MKRIAFIILCLQCGMIFSQDKDLEKSMKEADQYTSMANDILVDKGNFPKAEGEYRKAIAKNPVDATPKYNLANAYYGSEKYDEASQRYKEAAETATTKSEKHKAYHNQGNTYMEQKDYEKAVASYKNALRNNPKDNETRYNLALAKKMLEQQKQENDQNKDDQNQDQNKDQDNKDQKEGDDKKDQKGDEGDKDKEKGEDQKDDKGEEGDDKKEDGENKEEEGKEKEDDKKDKGNEGDDKKDEKEGQQSNDQQQQQVQGQLSPEQVKSLLEAMNNQEKKVQDKINAKKARGSKTRTDKDW